jgi:hypothetical protein
MPVAHAMHSLEPGDHLHVLHPIARIEQVKPMRNGLTMLLLDGREIRSGAFGFYGGGHDGFTSFRRRLIVTQHQDLAGHGICGRESCYRHVGAPPMKT